MKKLTNLGIVTKSSNSYVNTSGASKMTFGASKRRGSGCMSTDVANGRVRFGKELYEALGRPIAVEVGIGNDYMVYKPTDQVNGSCVFGKDGVLYYPELAEKVAEMAGINTDEVSGSVSVGKYQLQESDIEGVNEAVVSFK